MNNLNMTVETLAFIETLNITNLCIILDFYHMNKADPSIIASLYKVKEKLIFVHAADDNRKSPGLG